MTKIVTISREFGSGGRTVGKKAAEILGVPCYDSEIISEIAKQGGIDLFDTYIYHGYAYNPDSSYERVEKLI